MPSSTSNEQITRTASSGASFTDTVSDEDEIQIFKFHQLFDERSLLTLW